MIVVDVETSDVSPYKGGLLSIGAVEFENPSNQFYGECHIDANTSVSPHALKVNGFTQKEITDISKPSQTELVNKFLEWTKPIKDKTLGGHSTAFDVGFLRAAYKKAGHDRFPLSMFFIDMHNIVYGHMRKNLKAVPINKYGSFSITADRVYEYVGMPPEPKPHRGLTGAVMEAEAMGRLIYGKSIIKEFAQYPLPKKFSSL